MSVVLETQQNSNYEPTENEIMEYGKWLGMQLPEDNCFLWIAKEGLKAPLPENWKPCKSEKDELYYFNFKTGQSIWDHPMDDHYKELLKSEKEKKSTRSIEDVTKSSSKPGVTTRKSRSKSNVEVDEGSTSNTTGSSQGKVPKLNSLKLNKVLPDSLKINFEAPKSTSNSGLKLSSSETNSIQKDSFISKCDSKSTSNGLLSPVVHEEVIARGFNGVKALSRLSSPGGDKKGEEFETETMPPSLSSTNLANQKEDIEKDKALLTTQMNEELNSYKLQLSEKNNQAIEKFRQKMDQKLIEERRKVENEFSNNLAELRQEYDEQKKKESNILKIELKSSLEDEKKSIEDFFKKDLDEFRQRVLADSNKEKDAHSSVTQEGQKCVENLREFKATFLQNYEDCYRGLSQAFEKSFSDVKLMQERAEQKQKDVQLELKEIQDRNRTTILQEKERHFIELEELRQNHRHAVEEMNRLTESTLSSLRKEREKEVNEMSNDLKKIQALKEEQNTLEKQIRDTMKARTEEFEVTSASAITSSQEKLEKMKREIVENAKAELKFAIEKMNSDKHTISTGPSNYSSRHRQSSPNCYNNSKLSGDFYESVPVKLEKNSDNLKSESSQDSCKQQEQVFSESIPNDELFRPSSESNDRFSKSSKELETLKNAAIGLSEKSPFNISPSSKQRGNQNLSTPGSPPALSGTYHVENDVVKSERQRLLLVENVIDNQRQSFEERWIELHELRRQWKKAVSKAKKDGVRTNTQRGKDLKGKGMALERKSLELAREHEILRQSQVWLRKKQQRLSEYKNLLDEYSGRSFASTPEMEKGFSWSADTGRLMTDFFDPEQVTRSFNYDEQSFSNSLGPARANRSTSPMVASALLRFEKRLDKFSSIITRGNTPQKEIAKRSLSHRQRSPHTPSATYSSHPRRSRNNLNDFRELFERASSYADPVVLN